ncbi:unnamed protein product, partial [Dovyalis caffra]
ETAKSFINGLLLGQRFLSPANSNEAKHIENDSCCSAENPSSLYVETGELRAETPKFDQTMNVEAATDDKSLCCLFSSNPTRWRAMDFYGTSGAHSFGPTSPQKSYVCNGMDGK